MSALILLLLLAAGCSRNAHPTAAAEAEEEALARTEFTNRIENFFEYAPLKAGKASQFLIHLTDLNDGAPVEKAEVTLNIVPKGGSAASQMVGQTKAKVGKVTGIYVAEVTIPKAGDYDIEFRVKAEKLDEQLALTGFKVE